MEFEDMIEFDILDEDEDEELNFEEAMMKSIQKKIDEKQKRFDEMKNANTLEELKSFLLSFFEDDLKKDINLLKSLEEKKSRGKTIASA
jgi:hypothetical protein